MLCEQLELKLYLCGFLTLAGVKTDKKNPGPDSDKISIAINYSSRTFPLSILIINLIETVQFQSIQVSMIKLLTTGILLCVFTLCTSAVAYLAGCVRK